MNELDDWLLQICHCSSWQLEESRIHDPDTETATIFLSVRTPLRCYR